MSGEKPARHGKSNFLDKRSVSVVEELLTTHERVMPQLASIDKWPNIDGYLELQDANEVLLGRMEVINIKSAWAHLFCIIVVMYLRFQCCYWA